MSNQHYPLIINNNFLVYEFESIGEQGVKLIVYKRIEGSNWYNLGFADKDFKTGKIIVNEISDNGDSERVLATVAFEGTCLPFNPLLSLSYPAPGRNTFSLTSFLLN